MGGRVDLEEWKLRLTSAKVEVEVEAELGNFLNFQINELWLCRYLQDNTDVFFMKFET